MEGYSAPQSPLSRALHIHIQTMAHLGEKMSYINKYKITRPKQTQTFCHLWKLFNDKKCTVVWLFETIYKY